MTGWTRLKSVINNKQKKNKWRLGAAVKDLAKTLEKITGANAVKMEGGKEILESVERILCAGIPVMGHLGLTPQSINKFGTYVVRAKDEYEANKLREDALLLQEKGVFSIVLEKIPAALATEVSKSLHIPTIGIGAGHGCDGQVLVLQDMLGLSNDFSPRFLRRYNNLYTSIKDSVHAYSHAFCTINDIAKFAFNNSFSIREFNFHYINQWRIGCLVKSNSVLGILPWQE